MNYNTSRKKIVLPEYGRNIQNMVDSLPTIENKEERTKVANCLINVMSHLASGNQEDDFNHKLWDQLHIMSDFSLDVEAPYPLPEPEDVNKPPRKVNYYNVRDVKCRHYGRLIQSMVDKVCSMEDGEEKMKLVEVLAHQMKKLYLIWNRDTVDDDLIFNDLNALSEGRLSVNPEVCLVSAAAIIGNQDKRRKNQMKKNRKTNFQNNKRKKRQ